tara:strand:+ start:281 stop:421 length:141 start_codon:yes stop_codon:yes gene_type:complete
VIKPKKRTDKKLIKKRPAFFVLPLGPEESESFDDLRLTVPQFKFKG